MDDNHLTNLNPIEARILACLMEKQLATPDQYPLTQNSLLTACNQKTNRNPVMALSSVEVTRALAQLDEDKWIIAEMGSRTEHYQQKVSWKQKLTKPEQAILCMLMLRGPQTLNELLARTQRMVNSEDEIIDAISSLSERDEPVINMLPKQTGQREERYTQLLFDQGDLSQAQKTQTVTVSSPDSERIDRLEQELDEVKQLLQQLLDKSAD